MTTFQTRLQAHEADLAAGGKGIEIISKSTVVGKLQDGSDRLAAPADINENDVRKVDGDKVGPWAKTSAEAEKGFAEQFGG
jgi:hypothetical protein